MGRTLLIGSQTGVWRDWHREELASRDWVVLNPADAEGTCPGRFSLVRDGRVAAWRFAGSLDAMRSPHWTLAAATALLKEASEDAVVEMFPFRLGPLRLQLARLIVEAARPDRILIDRRTHFPVGGLTVLPEEVEVPDALPESVRAGHRKARWLQLFEQCERHELVLKKVALDGLRLGSGVPIPLENLRKFGFENPLHGESAGSNLLVVTDAPVGDLEVTRALDACHASKAHIVSPQDYENLICAFSREGGDDFAQGRIERIRFEDGVAEVSANAVAPAILDTLKVGSLRVDSEGRERGELKPWEA